MFPSHYGSRSTGAGRSKTINFFHVSIPLWFSLNTNSPLKTYVFKQFPSHYGSRSTQ